MVKKILSLMLWLAELLMIVLSFLVFSSTIEFCPWYEPLTMGAWLLVNYGLPIQILITLAFLLRYKKLPPARALKSVPLASGAMLCLLIVLTMLYEPLFYLACALFALADVLLLILWLRVILTRAGRQDLA